MSDHVTERGSNPVRYHGPECIGGPCKCGYAQLEAALHQANELARNLDEDRDRLRYILDAARADLEQANERIKELEAQVEARTTYADVNVAAYGALSGLAGGLAAALEDYAQDDEPEWPEQSTLSSKQWTRLAAARAALAAYQETQGA